MKATAAPTTNGSGATSAPVRLPTRKPPRRPEIREPRSVLEAVIFAACDPACDVQKLEHLVRLRKELEAAEAEHAFNSALAAAQAQMVPIVADAVNQHANGHKYATYAQLDRTVRPIYSAHGLSVTFNTGERSTDTAVEVACYLTGHGHGRRYSIVMPADGKGARGGDVMSRTHAAASAISYGMRYLLVMAFNLAIDRDDDGNSASTIPTPTKSAAQAKRDGTWPKFEAEIRAAKTLTDVDAVWARWRHEARSWPGKWRDHAYRMKTEAEAALGGTMQALKESAARLESEEHDNDRWLRNLEDTNRGRW
jgi:ERF superfamily